ncbi:MAG: hypothetical protein AVDCRST_MAG88-1159 [uncultured Thermomicrobiales bacterium]|uniref:SH3b domain-containing protein n=1 Tax=uncultured Thermomicrobiales bacterium TaxID=1645740 RepID=A0A6J4UR49_9BACT|nr:MAG: hypothetical protein AVDCRST_MAG88-1159 [uncultured Thermomicrobiales bacterium]
MMERKCSTCKHFEGAPIWKKGWCRNPLLYSPQQSHLVGEDDLDCNRGMGSYWEALDGEALEPEARAQESMVRFAPPPGRTIAPATTLPSGGGRRRAAPAEGAQPGSALPRRERNESATTRVSRPSPRGSATEPVVHGATRPAGGRPPGYDTSPERYGWGDYLRRAFPAIGALLLLGLFWVFISRQIAGGGEPATPTVPIATPPSSGPVNVIAPTAIVPPPAPDTSAAPAPPPPGVVAPGARIVIRTSGAGANIRERPTTNANVVTAQDDGVVLSITGPSQEADGFTWWPVRGDGFEGWVASALIEPAP